MLCCLAELVCAATATHKTCSAECWDVVVAVATLLQPVATLQLHAVVVEHFRSTFTFLEAVSCLDFVAEELVAVHMRMPAVVATLQSPIAAVATTVVVWVDVCEDCSANSVVMADAAAAIWAAVDATWVAQVLQ